ncbi:M57 family metalloprotease [Marinoscillum luteum]|jgi:predicted Zn-dependent protease|uniref:M57 family metalloprotease n=1 Tax=Marinoscillum luteum TaxID=861051 RepID=A0ABW7N494_9BACT
MSKLKFTLLSTVVLLASFTLVTSCTQDEVVPNDNAISDEISAKFEELGFDVSDMRKVNTTNPLTKETTSGFLLEGDIMIPLAQMESMLSSELFHQGPCGEQYRTNNLVSSPRTISVIGYTGGSQALDNTMRTALSWAVDNYNALNIGLTFTLSYGTNYGSKDIVVYKGGSGAGGSAGFPSGGNPYKYVQILSGTSSYGTNVTEHVITHEIGHCLGMRHTDYFNRSLSCGSGGNEGDGGVGANHIPGTPTGFDANSIMLSCFSSSEDGEFGSYDVTAFEYLY